MSEPAHGTIQRYRRGCRCDDCREANAAYSREWRKKNPKIVDNRPKAKKHGLTRYRKHGCRCTVCTGANRVAVRENIGAKARSKAKHGTRSRYVGGCRCKKCSTANKEYQQAYMRRWRARKEAQA